MDADAASRTGLERARPPDEPKRPPQVGGTRADPVRHLLTVMRWPLGGIRTYLLYTHPALVRAGWRITFVGPEGEHLDSFAAEVAQWPGVDCIPAPRGRRPAFLARATSRLLARRDFTLVNAQGLGAGAQVELARKVARLRGRRIPLVVTSHDVFPPGAYGGPVGWAKKRILERLLARADLIINVSDDARENLLQHLPLLRKRQVPLVTIPNRIRLPSPHGAGAAGVPLRATLGIAADTFLMGFLGRFMEQKGFLPLLDALEDLRAQGSARPFHLVAVGSGDFENEYRAEVEQRGLSATVSFLPFTPHVTPTLQQLDLVVMPSLWEAAPLLAMETLMAGVPLLASDCVGLREVVRDTPALVAPVGDRAAWAEALRAAIADPPVEAVRQFLPEARSRFDVERTARRLVALLEDVATGRAVT